MANQSLRMSKRWRFLRQPIPVPHYLTEDMENSLFPLSLKHPFTYLKTVIMSSLRLLFSRLNKLILSLFLHNSYFLILWSTEFLWTFSNESTSSLEGGTQNVHCFPTKAAEWQHCFVFLKRWNRLHTPACCFHLCVPWIGDIPFILPRSFQTVTLFFKGHAAFSTFMSMAHLRSALWDQPPQNRSPASCWHHSPKMWEKLDELLTLGSKARD